MDFEQIPIEELKTDLFSDLESLTVWHTMICSHCPQLKTCKKLQRNFDSLKRMEKSIKETNSRIELAEFVVKVVLVGGLMETENNLVYITNAQLNNIIEVNRHDEDLFLMNVYLEEKNKNIGEKKIANKTKPYTT